MSFNGTYEKELAFQADRRRATVEFIKIASDLWYDKSIELVLFRNQLMDKNVSQILNLHEYAGKFVQKPISIFDSVEIAQAIKNFDLPPAKLDIGKLTYEYHLEDDKYNNAAAFIASKLKGANSIESIKPKDVILYGFGRIGRMVFRAIAKDFTELEVVGINDLLDNDYLAYMLKYDTAHGRFDGDIVVDGDNFVINGKKIRLSAERNPADLAWGDIDVDVVIDCTGFFLTEESCQAHIDAGAKKVVQSAPSKDDTPMFVYGVNHTK